MTTDPTLDDGFNRQMAAQLLRVLVVAVDAVDTMAAELRRRGGRRFKDVIAQGEQASARARAVIAEEGKGR
jgi:hypothetical protein